MLLLPMQVHLGFLTHIHVVNPVVLLWMHFLYAMVGVGASSAGDGAVGITMFSDPTLFNVEAIFYYLVDIFTFAHRCLVIEA